MQTSRQPLERIISADPEGSGYKTVAVDLNGRLMCADFNEYHCLTAEMSPAKAYFRCAARPLTGERIVAYVDHIGRIEGKVSSLTDDGFRIEIKATDRKRQKLAAQLNWFANRNEFGVECGRRPQRRGQPLELDSSGSRRIGRLRGAGTPHRDMARTSLRPDLAARHVGGLV